MTKEIILGGSRGIGKAISDSLKSINLDVIATSKNDLDTSNLDSVSEFVEKYKVIKWFGALRPIDLDTF